MRIISTVMITTLMISVCNFAQAYDLHQGERVPAVGVNDKGELLWQHNKFSYENWNSAQLSGKVRVIQHIAGRSSAKEKNAALIEAIKAAKFPHGRYQTTTIVNTDDAIPGTGMFVRSSVQTNKEHYPWSQFIIDNKGNVQKAWQLESASSAIVVLDKNGQIRFIKDGALSHEEVRQVISLVQDLLKQ